MSCREVPMLVDQLVAETISEFGCSHLEQSERVALEVRLVEIYSKNTLAFLFRILPQEEAKEAALKLANLAMRDQEIAKLLAHAPPYLRELRSELLETKAKLKSIHEQQLEQMLRKS